MQPQPSAPGKRMSRTAQMVGELSSRLQDGRLMPGSRLTERALGEEFHASRTVVREAVSRLEATGWVRSVRGVGTIVVEPAVRCALAPLIDAAGADPACLRELRAGFEIEAAVLAARRRNAEDIDTMKRALDAGPDAALADRAFHLAVARATHNPHYSRILSLILNLPLEEGHRPAEHEDIFRAIERADGDAARAHMRVHLATKTARPTNHQRGASE